MAGLAAVAASQIIIDAMTDIRIAHAGDVLAPETLEFGRSKLSRLMDRWCADPRTHYAVGFPNFVPIPNHQPHTIGPQAADWNVTQRPATIKSANLIWNAVTPTVRIPLRIRDGDWWSKQRVQGLATSVPTDLYYSADWPNGSVYLWPIPTMSYPIELEMDTLFADLKTTDLFWLPFGYRDAITGQLAMSCAPGMGQPVSADLEKQTQKALDIIYNVNDRAPNQVTRDAGMPSGGRHRGRYNYMTGMIE